MIDHLILYCVPEASGRALRLAVSYEARYERYLVFGPDDLRQLKERLALCDHVSGFDLISEGLPALYGVAAEEFRLVPAHRSLSGKTTDLLAQAAQALGRAPYAPEFRGIWTLPKVAHATLNRLPVDPGGAALDHLVKGSFHAAVSFALDSAGLVKELVWFANRFGYLVGPAGQRVNVRGPGSWSPYSCADPVSVMEMEAGRGVPATQTPASLAELLAHADDVSSKADAALARATNNNAGGRR